MRNYIYIILDWFLIILCCTFVYYFRNLASFIVFYFIVGSRQHAFFANQHEASHGHLSKNKFINDFLAMVLCSFPMGHNFRYFKEYHLMHHRFLNTDLDPSYVPVKHDVNWIFPMRKSNFLKICIKDFLGLNFKVITIYESLYSRQSNSLWVLITRFGFYFLLPIVTYLISNDLKFSFIILSLWILTKYTFLVWLIRIRTIVEHSGPFRCNEESRDIDGSLLEKFFILPHHVGFHFQHHNRPDIPAYLVERSSCKYIYPTIFGNKGILKDLIKA